MNDFQNSSLVVIDNSVVLLTTFHLSPRFFEKYTSIDSFTSINHLIRIKFLKKEEKEQEREINCINICVKKIQSRRGLRINIQKIKLSFPRGS